MTPGNLIGMGQGFARLALNMDSSGKITKPKNIRTCPKELSIPEALYQLIQREESRKVNYQTTKR